ncbi:MAG: polysaccharide pyruvyl transferase family protein [Coriobacteriia bacterium]|nr:polysaccharide pyruvyl transferase family protein [Coriobacteriia bacterium]
MAELNPSRTGSCLLAYLYGTQNAGDFAICYGALDFLTSRYNQVYAVSRYNEKDEEFAQAKSLLETRYGHAVRLMPGPFTLDRHSKFSTLSSYAKGLISLFWHSVLPWKRKIVENVDCVYVNGGNLLRCASLTDSIRLKPFLYFAQEAKKLDVPYVLLPQSTSTISASGKRYIEDALAGASLTFFRESVSFRKANNLNLPNVKLAIDMAYFIEDGENQKAINVASSTKDRVCFTFRRHQIGDIGLLDDDKVIEIEKKIRDLVVALRDAGEKVAFVVQTKKDIDFTEEVYAAIGDETIEVVEEYDPLKLRELYRQAKCLIGMRLHSIILASSVGTPVVGYFDKSWGNKNEGTLADLKMPCCFVGDDYDLYSLYASSMVNLAEMNSTINCRKRLLRTELDGL